MNPHNQNHKQSISLTIGMTGSFNEIGPHYNLFSQTGRLKLSKFGDPNDYGIYKVLQILFNTTTHFCVLHKDYRLCLTVYRDICEHITILKGRIGVLANIFLLQSLTTVEDMDKDGAVELMKIDATRIISKINYLEVPQSGLKMVPLTKETADAIFEKRTRNLAGLDRILEPLTKAANA